jgi:hypothetical protein
MPTFFAGQTDYIEKLNDVDAAAGAAQDDIDAHIADTTAAHAASAISNTPAGNVSATTVQAAINELDSEKLSASATALPSSFASASINSITPTGGALAVIGAINATGILRTDLSASGNALVLAGTSASNMIVALGSSGSPTRIYNTNAGGFAFRDSGDAADVLAISNSGVSVTGSISATTRVNYPSFTVATLPAVGSAGGNIYVSDESGGAQPAFSDGTNWRRYTDRAVVS